MPSLSTAAGYLTLASRIAGAFARLAAERVEEGIGRTLPRTPQQLARPEVVGELLRGAAPGGASRLSPLPSLPPVRAVRLSGVDFESSNCRNFLIDVEFEGGPVAGEGHSSQAPRTLYAKLPCAELSTRAFANAVGFWEVEATFCERIAGEVPIRVPRVFAVARRGTRFVLLLENLHEQPGVRLFVNRDMAAGTSPDRARLCLRTFAELHAAFWGWSHEQREALLPFRLHPYAAPRARAMSRALNAAAISGARRAAPDLFTSEHASLCRLAIRKWDALLDAWYREPLTLIHGDSHLANCFEYGTPEGPRVGMIDFQGLQWCQGIRDVQYHLTCSLESDVLAEYEETLIDDYLGELRRRGVELDPAQAREQYRALSFQTLMVAVVSIGLGSLTEQSETLRTVLRRSLAAVDRLGFADWLAGL